MKNALLSSTLATLAVIAAVAHANPQPSPAPPLRLVKRQSLSPAEKSEIISEISGYLTDPLLSSGLNMVTEPQYLSSLSEEYASIYGSETASYAVQAFTSLLAEAESQTDSQASPTSSAQGTSATPTADSSQSAQASSAASAASSIASAGGSGGSSSSSGSSSNAAASLQQQSIKTPLLAAAGLGGAIFVFAML